MKSIKINDYVKFVEPLDEFEQKLVMRVVNINDVTKRVIVELDIKNMKIKPTQLLGIKDVVVI